MLDAKTIGLDISDRFTSYCLLDETGEILEEGRLRTTPASLGQRLSCLAGRVVVEAGTHSPWVSRLFTEAGLHVIVANPRKVRLIAEATRKNDRADAETLARLGRLDPKLLSPITHRSAQAQADLAMVRARSSLISARTLLINHVRGAVKSMGTRLPVCDANTFHRVARANVPEGLAIGLAPLLDSIEVLTEKIKGVDRLIRELVETRYPAARALQQVAGVGPLISLTFILTF